MKKSILFKVFIIIALGVQAQNKPNPWLPAYADTTFPRTIIHSSEIQRVKDSLKAGRNIEVYRSLYLNALVSPPSGNSTISEKAARSEIAKNAAFVYLLGVKPVGNTTDTLTTGEKSTLRTSAITMLNEINTYVNQWSIDSPFNFDFWQYTSREIIKYAEAYDFLKGAGTSDALLISGKSKLKELTGNLYGQTAKSVAGAGFFQSTKNNNGLMSAAALGVAAVVLNDLKDLEDERQPLNWINCAMWNIHNTLFWDIRRQSDTKKYAGYAEGPYYFRVAFCNVLPFMKAMGNFIPDTAVFYKYSNVDRRLRNPWYDTNYTKIFDWYAAIRMPDGRMPTLEDTYNHKFFPELAILRQPKYVWKQYYSGLDSLQENTFNKQITSIYDMRADYVAANLVESEVPDSQFVVMPNAGIAVFRSGSDSAATYLSLTGKNDNNLIMTDAHNQADEASISMMVNGQPMLLDPGMFFYLFRDSVSHAENHNMILVDGKATTPGYPNIAGGANAFIEKCFQSGVQNYAEVRTRYQKADINRKVLHVRNKYFLLADHMHGDTTHEYSMLLHGYGRFFGDTTFFGAFNNMLSSNRAAWLRREAGVFTYTESDQAFTMSTKLMPHEHTLGFLQYHNMVSAVSPVTKDMSYLTCIQPFRNLATDTFAVVKLDLSGALGFKVTDGTINDLAVNQSQGNTITINKATTGLTNSYTTDGKFVFVSEDGGVVKDLFVHKGMSMLKDNDTMWSAQVPFNMQFLSSGTKAYKGYCGDIGEVRLHVSEYPYEVLGEGVWSVKYDATAKVATVYFGKATSFTIKVDDAKTGIQEMPEPASIHLYPNPAQSIVTVDLGTFTTKPGMVELLDISGKRVAAFTIDQGMKTFEMPVSNFDNGLYFVAVHDGTRKHAAGSKLIIAR